MKNFDIDKYKRFCFFLDKCPKLENNNIQRDKGADLDKFINDLEKKGVIK